MTAIPETLTELRAALATGAMTPTALVERSLERIHRLDDRLHAFTSVYAEHALHRAHDLDLEAAAGAHARPLYGIPIALKDAFDVARQLTLAGSRLLEGNIAVRDAEVVSRLLAAGMIVIGKTHMVELAFGGWGTNAVMGTPRNPWDERVHRVPGGSSSGSAVAVAARLVPAALGTDTGGSVRIPAAMCGIVGFKPGAEKISQRGVVPLAETLDSVGPLTQTTADARLLYEALSGETAPVVAAGQSVRIAVLDDDELQGISAGVARGFETAVELLSGADTGSARFRLDRLRMSKGFEELVGKNGLIMSFEGWRNHGLAISQAPPIMDPHVYARFAAGSRVSAEQYAQALRERALEQAAFASRLQGFDALLTPATPQAAVPLREVDEHKLPLNRYARGVNYLGLAALTLPVELDECRLPVAIQLVGLPGSEFGLLSLGERFEALRGPFPAPPLRGA